MVANRKVLFLADLDFFTWFYWTLTSK